MQIIISPAKKMKIDSDTMLPTQLPAFLEKADHIRSVLQTYTVSQLKTLYRCNDAIATLNYDRLQTMVLEKAISPAILSYEGIQFQYMGAQIFEKSHFEYLEKHLRILSALYGMLRPLDAVTPYRLEMQAKLQIDEHKNLYAFWGDLLANHLMQESDVILNLASKEYSRCVQPHLPQNISFVTCVFGELQEGKIVEKGTMCKMARGEMVRFLAENGIQRIEDVKAFHSSDYHYADEYSDQTQLVFLRR